MQSLVSSSKSLNYSLFGSISSEEADDTGEAQDLQMYDSDNSLGSSTEEWEQSSVSSSSEYGGRGEPEKIGQVNFFDGDIVEFNFEGSLCTGIVDGVSQDSVIIKHLDKKYSGKRYEYSKKDLTELPNWISIQSDINTIDIKKFAELKLEQLINFTAIDVDDEGVPI